MPAAPPDSISPSLLWFQAAPGPQPRPCTSPRRPSSNSPAPTSPTRPSATTTTMGRTRSRSLCSLSALTAPGRAPGRYALCRGCCRPWGGGNGVGAGRATGPPRPLSPPLFLVCLSLCLLRALGAPGQGQGQGLCMLQGMASWVWGGFAGPPIPGHKEVPGCCIHRASRQVGAQGTEQMGARAGPQGHPLRRQDLRRRGFEPGGGGLCISGVARRWGLIHHAASRGGALSITGGLRRWGLEHHRGAKRQGLKHHCVGSGGRASDTPSLPPLPPWVRGTQGNVVQS